jgi:hypothetical protein
MQDTYEGVKDSARVFAGTAVIETFGEGTFVPGKCEHAVTLSRYQQEKLTYMRNESMKIMNRYIPNYNPLLHFQSNCGMIQRIKQDC